MNALRHTRPPARIMPPPPANEDHQPLPVTLLPCATLGRTEIAAVMTGRADATRFGWEATAPARAWRRVATRLLVRLTGADQVRPFADARLEKLRLFAAMIARNDRRGDAMSAELLGLGFTPAMLHQAIRLALG